MQSPDPLVVVLATGGTIAGLADKAGDNTGYRAGQVGIAELRLIVLRDQLRRLARNLGIERGEATGEFDLRPPRLAVADQRGERVAG